jgi:hypothetical protein
VLLCTGVGLTLGLLAWGVFAKDSLNRVAVTSVDWVIANFAWLFVAAADAFLVLAVVLACGRYGRIRLARSDAEEPEFATLAWIAMMFSAGMGIGLMFYGVGEPLAHLAAPAPGGGDVPGSALAARTAMAATTACPVRSYRCSVRGGRPAGPGVPSTCWPCSPPCSAAPPASGSVRSRSPPVSTTSTGCTSRVGSNSSSSRH